MAPPSKPLRARIVPRHEAQAPSPSACARPEHVKINIFSCDLRCGRGVAAMATLWLHSLRENMVLKRFICVYKCVVIGLQTVTRGERKMKY